MRYLILAILAMTIISAASAADNSSSRRRSIPTQIPLFTAGEGGYHTFRIPSLLPTKNGALLAFAEGRKQSGGDSGAIDLVLRRSTDGGKTWGPITVVWADGENTCGNPCPVVDSATGAISLLTTHNLGTDHEKQIEAGTSQGTRTVWLLRSTDDGLTWSAPQDITAATKRPDWGWYATGPGIGIQIRQGAHKGRLVVPCNHSELATKQSRSHAIFSDDGGKTWKLGGGSPQDHTNESQMAEVADGKLVLNMRSADPAHKQRSVCFSADGGESWTDFHYEDALIEPICQGSVISLPQSGPATLLFSNPASATARQDLTVRMSMDGGHSWPNSNSLYAGPSAYSCLAALPDGEIACLYERGATKPYDAIYLARFNLDWLREGKAAAATQPVPSPSADTLVQTTVFAAKTDGYNTFRIPALVSTTKGTLLAFAEGRRNGRGDAGAIDLVLRRSPDGGKTWGSLTVVWTDGDNTCGNPCPVVDEESGAILLLMTRNLGGDHQKEITAGTSQGTRTVWITRSEDDGGTWSVPREITSSAKLPDWKWYATGPGIGIQLRQGAHKGRIVVPCDHSEPAGERSHVIYSDDRGVTWHVGGGSPETHTDESQVAELNDGRLMFNMRGATAKERSRAVCVSADGGETWTDFHHDPALVESRCQGSLLSFFDSGAHVLVFSNPADPTIRQNLTVRLSHDDGKTWPLSRTLNEGPSGYSCLTSLADGSLGCLYECGAKKSFEQITFARFRPTWLAQTRLR